MRLPNTLISFAIVSVAFGTPAYAQEFNGPFIGVQAGWNSDEVKDTSTPLGAAEIDLDHQSLTGGVYAGYDFQLNEHTVLGAEASFDLASDDKLRDNSSVGTYTLNPKYSFDLTARAGYLVTPETLVYARGGYSNARATTTVMDTDLTSLTSGNLDGWLAGAGIERKLMDNVSARLEYRYSDLSEGDGEYDRNRVLAGLTYRF